MQLLLILAVHWHNEVARSRQRVNHEEHQVVFRGKVLVVRRVPCGSRIRPTLQRQRYVALLVVGLPEDPHDDAMMPIL